MARTRDPKGPSVKVGVTNVVLSNAGDSAIFHGIKSILEEAGDCSVVAFDSNAATTASLYPSLHIVQQLLQAPPGRRTGFLIEQSVLIVVFWALSSLPWLFRRLATAAPARGGRLGVSLRELASCDVVVSNGGTYLVDHYDFTHRYVELRCAKALGKPIVLWTQSIGPLGTRRARWLARRIAAIVDAVYCRDSRSAHEWRTATGYKGPLELAADAAFALSPTRDRMSDGHRDVPRAALSVRQWSRGVDNAALDRTSYVAMMRAASEVVDQLGWHGLAISTCQGLETYGYDDSAVASRIFEGLEIEIDSEFHTPFELLDVLDRCDLVITTRMHFAILALLSRVPVIAVAYEFKTVDLFESVGLSHAVIRIEDSSSEWMSATILKAAEIPDRFCLTDATVDRLRTRAALPGELVKRFANSAMTDGA